MLDPDTLDPDRPVLIAGPTASGKSGLALTIAERQGGVIVNADALQVFEDWRVLTARPARADEARAPHVLYGHIPGDTAYSVGQWLRDLEPYLAGQRPIIVGGTGLYFTALTKGLAEIPRRRSLCASRRWPGSPTKGSRRSCPRSMPRPVRASTPATRCGSNGPGRCSAPRVGAWLPGRTTRLPAPAPCRQPSLRDRRGEGLAHAPDRASVPANGRRRGPRGGTKTGRDVHNRAPVGKSHWRGGACGPC